MNSLQRRRALFHLAELYAHTDRPHRSLEALQAALGSPEQGGGPNALHDFLMDLDGDSQPLVERWASVAENSAQRLPRDDWAVLEAYSLSVESVNGDALKEMPRWRLHLERLTVELARRLETAGRFGEALACYQRLIDRASVTEAVHPADALEQIHAWQQAFVRNGLKLARDAKTPSQRGEACEQLSRLNEASWLSTEQREWIVLALLEQLVALNQPREALAVLDAFPVHNADSQTTVAASLTLRRAELLAAIGQKTQALECCLAAIERYPEFQLNHSLHYLAGRLYISRADFASARHHLTIAATAPNASVDDQSKAQWMIGETYFLQQQFAAAIDAYQQLTAREPVSRWHARGLLQTAKCHELLEQPQKAVGAYQAFIDVGQQQNDFAAELELARQRIAQLESMQRTSQAPTLHRDLPSLNR